MVFEAIVVDVLNRFLGDYVENLNSNQLKIGIWGGDVVLENLVLKQNALDDLDLPVQTIYGHLGKLVLKIPWKNLYGASVEVSVERLFLLVAPNQEVKYDPQKEEKIYLQNKQSELQRVEEAKKRELEKDQKKVDDSFVEKLVTQIIKNVQLNIKDIHIRYEDKITNPGSPFALGVSLHNLEVISMDANWRKTVVDQTVTKIFKVLELEGLALYWNPNTVMYSLLPKDEMFQMFMSEIATKSNKPTSYKYVLGPINASAKLKLNPKPELDSPMFSTPKCVLNLDMDQLAIGITKAQYQDIMRLADSMDRMTKGLPYRKYRPFLNEYKGHYKEWWKFAYTCVLEEDVKRRRRNWDWNHICEHRETCKKYAAAYQTKLQTPPNKIPADLVHLLENCEKTLDLFNLVVIRQRIEMEVARLSKSKEEANKNKSWFGWWWGSKSAKDEELSDTTDIMKQFEKAMTPDEKAKLYQAIDYQENTGPTHLPIEFIATECHFMLSSLVLNVTDDYKDVITSKLNNVQASFEQRPSASAMRVVVRMQEFTVSGVEQGTMIPRLVTSKQVTPGISLLDVMFETNPLDELCGQRIKVSARPLQMVYDAQTINKIVEVFKPPSESSALAQLQAAAENKLSNLKEKSALGLQYAVSQHTVMDIDIDVCSSYLIMPHSGIFTRQESCIIVNFGAITIKSAPRSDKALDIHQLYKEGADNDEIFKQTMKHAYDKFILKLTDLQILVADKDEDWLTCISEDQSTPLHLLQPTTLSIEIAKCLITNDPRLPKIKVYGYLPQIGINVAEERLMKIIEIIVSTPFPQGEENYPLRPTESRSSSLSLLKYFDPAENKKRQQNKKEIKKEDDVVQLTEVEAEFVMGELLLCVLRATSKEIKTDMSLHKLISFGLNSLELKAVQRTMTLEASASLGSVDMMLYYDNDDPLHMVQTLRGDNDFRQYLFTVRYCNVNKKCPEFHSHYGSVEQLIELDFTTVQLLLHQEGILELMKVAGQYQTRLSVIQGSRDRIATAGTPLSTIPEDQEMPAFKVAKASTNTASRAKRRGQVETIGLKVNISMEQVGVKIATSQRSLALMAVTGLKAGLIMKNSYTQVNATLQDIKVIDHNPNTIHKQILSVVGGNALTMQLVMYNMEHYSNVDSNDMTIDAQISCIRIIFLNWFVSTMLKFLDNFQTAVQAVKDASAMAAESAKANVQNAYEKATKFGMNIRLKAPIVIAPENSMSPYAVMVDLGYITMTNKFMEMDVKQEHKVVVDELSLELDNFKLSRVKLSIEGDVSSEKMLLQPTTFTLIVKRNLTSWYNKIPNIDMSGRLKAIMVRIANEDFKMLMKILSENLTEGAEAVPEPSAVRPQLKTTISMDSRQTHVSKKAEGAVHALKRMDSVIKDPEIVTTIKFTFTMDSLTIEMMNKVSNVIHAQSPFGTSDEVGLARFSLKLLSIKGKMLSDNSMYTSLLLVDCLLDDMRPNREAKITRFMERKTDVASRVPDNSAPLQPSTTNDKLRSMIDVTFTQKQSDIFMDVRIFSFHLILSMDFLLKISDFVTSGLTPPEPKAAIEQQAVKPAEANPKATRKISKSGKDQKATVTKLEDPKKTEGMITINLKVEKPDIILVESLEGRKTCQALVLNNEISLKVRMSDQLKVINGSIEQLYLYTCSFGRSGVRYTGCHTVLAPCDLSLQATARDDRGWHVDIIFTDILLNVSPATIDLLNRVVVTMTKSEDDVAVKENEIAVYKNLWEMKPFEQHNFWFLKTDLAEDALEVYSNQTAEDKVVVPSGEICLLSAPVIVLTIEAGLGSETMPMLSMQTSLVAQVKDWSGQLTVESTWTMQVSYYNESLALWEPLIEPVEVQKDNKLEHVPWELKIQVQMNKQSSPSIGSPSQCLSPVADVGGSVDAVDGELVLPQPSLVVQLNSSDALELTLTTSALHVLSQLSASFSSVVKGGSLKKSSGILSPYLMKNETGLTVMLLLNKDAFAPYFQGADASSLELASPPIGDTITLEHGDSIPLQLKSGICASTRLNQKLPQWNLHVKIVELDCTLCLPVVRADKRYFPLKANLDSTQTSAIGLSSQDCYGLISQVSVVEGSIHITLRSIMQVTNNLSVPVEVHFMTLTGNYVESLGTVEPKEVMNLPLRAVHTPTSEIFFSIEGYNVSVKPFTWKDLQKSIKETKLLLCTSKNRNQKDRFFLKAVGEMQQVFLGDTTRHTMASACFNIKLCPAVVLQNCLPVDIVVSPQGIQNPEEHTVKPGETLHLPQVEPGSTQIVVMLPTYLEKCWVCTREIPEVAPEFSIWTFDSHDSTMRMNLELGMHCSVVNGSQHFSLYCPFWMLNKTGLTLAYRKSKKSEGRTTDSPLKSSEELTNVLFHPPDYKEPILFSFRAKNFFGKKKASIRVGNGEWSEKFSLDIPGSSGVVLCKSGDLTYQIGVTNRLTYNSLTKQVIFTPYFLLINKAPFPIECQEFDRPADSYIKVEAKSSIPLWPRSLKDTKLLRIKAADDPAISAPCLYTEQHTTLLKLNNQYGGINVETLVTEGGIYVTFGQYQPGLAPALVINHTQYEVKLWEKENVNVWAIKPMHSLLYTWANPAGPRTIFFEGFKKKEVENDLRKDGLGEFMVGNETRVFWVSFLDGMQRVLLFTSDLIIAHSAHTAGEAGSIDMEVTLSMHGVGLSVVNNIIRQELLYISIASSGIIWEQCKHGSKRFKALSITETAMVEDAYQRFLSECEVAKKTVPGRALIDTKTEVDFELMEMLRPHKRRIRRTLQPGMWVQYGAGSHRSQLHARLHRLQIDQQLPAPTFPVVLAPVPPPRSVASSQALKPFVELCIIQRLMEHTDVKQYKYFKLLVQEFHVKVDMGLVNALMDMFPGEEISESDAVERFSLDRAYAGQPLESVVAEYTATDQKNFYDMLHLSPIKVHVSFSMGGAEQLPSFLGTVLQGLGVTLTDMNDVIFKLAYYERTYEFLSQKELVSTATSHYTGQALKQLYVLVLGLDVIGNPYGLVIGLTKGVEDLFYEPFQGAIQGPGEFAEGLMLGVRSLFGHAVGGAAGAVSRITGAMGHGLAALSLDSDYQRKRRDNISKRPANLQEGLARSGKGLFMGVVDGVTGVFTKPISGAREEGAVGFFKGLGKGAVGLVTRPTAGVVDFASGSFDAVKRAADMSTEVSRKRPPRWLESDGLVRPYSKFTADGYRLLRDLDKGKYVNTDIYITHIWVVAQKEVVLCTDKRIAYLEKNTVFGGWQIVWSYTWLELPNAPTVVDKGVFVHTVDGKKKGVFSSGTTGKVILIPDEQTKKHLSETCTRLMKEAR